MISCLEMRVIMEYQNNMLKRNISSLIRMTAIIAFGAFQEKYKQPKFVENTAEDSLYLRLVKLIDEGELNEAENILIEKVEDTNLADLQLALDVYAYMNEKSDEFLNSNDFERFEIEDGVRATISKFGYGALI